MRAREAYTRSCPFGRARLCFRGLVESWWAADYAAVYKAEFLWEGGGCTYSPAG